MAKEQNITLPLQVTVSESTYKDLQKMADTEHALPKIQGWATWYLRQLAAGGLTLTSEQMQAIEKTTGEEIKTADDIIRKLQAAVGRDDGQYTVKVGLDPVYYPNLEETARIQGRTPDELMSEVIHYAIEQQWVYGWAPSGGSVPFSEAGISRLKRYFDKRQITEADILGLIDGKTQAAA